MIHILNMSLSHSQISREIQKGRSRSSNPDRNKIKKIEVRRDRSASTERNLLKGSEDGKRHQKQRKTILTAMVPIIKKSITPVGKFFSKRLHLNTPQNSCEICYAEAKVKHLGIFLCGSCKDFFDQYSFKQDTIPLKCPENGYCMLQSFKLEMCSACRLKKFIDIGLEPRLHHQNALVSVGQPTCITSLNLLHRDISLLTSDYWSLLSNLVHCFDVERPKALANRFIAENPSDSCPKICFKIPSYYNDLIESMYSVTYAFIYNNRDVYNLPEMERHLAHRHGYNNIAMLCGPVVTRHLHLLENRGFINSLDLSFGVANRKCSEYIAAKLDCDPYFIMFVMAIYVFSSSSYINFRTRGLFDCNDVAAALTVFRIQNVYTEATWKYLIYRYSFEDAVKRFDNLIQCFIVAQNSLALMENDRQHEEIRESFINEVDLLLD